MAGKLPFRFSTLHRFLGALVVTVLAMAGWSATALGQVSGTSASVVLEAESTIVLDGQLDDWANVPAIVTVGGPVASEDPGANGRLRWQVSADPNTIFFAATITDATIVAGENGENYWNEDSLEFYLNFSGDLAATGYGEGISQIRISAVDIGATNPQALTLTGIGLDQHEVTGFVFATNEGWGTEIAVDVSTLVEPVVGERFGLQVQANGSSGGDRDLKLSWSAADVNDTSFEDPSVFAQGVFVTAAAASSSSESESDSSNDSPDTIGAAGNGESVQAVDSIADGGPAVVTGDEQRRSLLIAAVVSSIAVFFGGLWFERKRKADEARHAAARVATPVVPSLQAGAEDSVDGDRTPHADSEFDIDDEEFDALLESILDDDAPTDGYE